METISKNLDQTKQFAEELVCKLTAQKNSAAVLALYGDLGSGKTTFTQFFAGALGVKEKVTSPTFVLEKFYDLKKSDFKKLIHIDCYRLKGEEDLLNLGWQDIVADEKNIIVIEWPERVEKILPKNTKKIYFEFVDETTRKVTTDR